LLILSKKYNFFSRNNQNISIKFKNDMKIEEKAKIKEPINLSIVAIMGNIVENNEK